METTMISKILIANRGEIACRIMRTAKRLGIATVAVYSDEDMNALHVKTADQAVRLGPAKASESYLCIDKIIQAAQATGADAIHPGYGFLSENAQFAQACIENDLIFIGPSVDAIKAMGSKSAAKTIMQEAKVPLVPGYHGEQQSPELLAQEAEKIAYPVLLKAAAGGGGKGMRIVWQAEEFDSALAAAKREAQASFSDQIMLVEKYLTEPRHVEIQVFCDQHGNAVYLFERDCSVQRRHQKVVEEAPAPGLKAETRAAMGEAAVRAAQAINYCGAGTVEFLLDSDGKFYFMEMNTRLQVEHPVTEMITGQDLVEWQIIVANGQPLPMEQSALQINGHAMEVRIYAEDPNNEFLPCTGLIKQLIHPPESTHLRLDTGVSSGDSVGIHYDPMIAKLIVSGENRAQAIARMDQALNQYVLVGVTTNTHYLQSVINTQAFKHAQLTTDFVERHANAIADYQLDYDWPELATLACFALLSEQVKSTDVWYQNTRLNHHSKSSLALHINETLRTFEIISADDSYTIMSDNYTALSMQASMQNGRFNTLINDVKTTYVCYADGQSLLIANSQGQWRAQRQLANHLSDQEEQQDGAILAPMNGSLIALSVNSGDRVKKGDLLAIVEAMKMEHNIKAPANGVVTECHYQEGDLVEGGKQIMLISPEAEA